MVTFEDFTKLEIRIGTIESVEKAEGAEKLLKFVIDFGTEKKQIMSGIAEFVTDTQALVGLQVPVLINIPPRKFRGHESQGMIIMADGATKPVLLHPAEKVEPGSTVR